MKSSWSKMLHGRTKSDRDRKPENNSGNVSNSKAQETPIPLIPDPPSIHDKFRYRYHHGTNLGGIFVLERWLHGSMFGKGDGCGGDSELDAVTVSLQIRGLVDTRRKWQEHWNSALTDNDLRWLSETAHCTTIRLPIGYFTLGSQFCNGTPFAGQIAEVYENAWNTVKWIIARCFKHGIGVLLDFHALPGGANGEAHSGTSSGRAELWSKKAHIDLALRCLVFMAQEIRGAAIKGVVGIQLCNEAEWNAKGLYQFYEMAIERISEVDTNLPIYISDAWDLKRALEYGFSKNSLKVKNSNPIIVDTHRYYTFAAKDTCRGPDEIIAQIPSELTELESFQRNIFQTKGATATYVGEYSCTLSQTTWSKVAESDRVLLTKNFGQVQSRRWQQKTCGSAFWTLKSDWMPGGDWGFLKQVEEKAVLIPRHLQLSSSEIERRVADAKSKCEDLHQKAVSDYRSSLGRQDLGQTSGHRQFMLGWKLGWSDAQSFFNTRPETIVVHENSRDDSKRTEMRAGKIGVLDLWVLKRMRQVHHAADSIWQYGWEWEQGFRRGIFDFQTSVGI